MEANTIPRLDTLLRKTQFLLPESDNDSSSLPFEEVYDEICELVFLENVPQFLWDEAILSQLTWLFTKRPPDMDTWGGYVDLLNLQQQKVCQVNDFFFSVIKRNGSPEEIQKTLNVLCCTDNSFVYQLKSLGDLENIKKSDEAPSEKISSFLEHIRDDIGVNLTEHESIIGCLESLKKREGIGRVNALLVREGYKRALVIPLELILQPGSGKVDCSVPSGEDFVKAIERTRCALQGGSFLQKSLDVNCCLDLTEPKYIGSSMALAAAVGMYSAAGKLVIDPFTTFTGDVKPENGEWKVKNVTGISKKISAARRSGCRRVFIPSENLGDIDPNKQSELEIIGVNNVIDVLLHLQSSPQPISDDSVQANKINAVHLHCRSSGWTLSDPRLIQNGIQYRIAPLNQPELVVTFYDSGTHVANAKENVCYDLLLEELAALSQKGISIRPVNKTFNIKDLPLRGKIHAALEQLNPQEKRDEQHCEYYFRYEDGKERLVVKQFKKGTLHLQGSAGDLYKKVLEVIINLYNLLFPNAKLSVEKELGEEKEMSPASAKTPSFKQEISAIPLPHIGTDESGKGDYFGPLVVAGVQLDSATLGKLENLGIKDSKQLSDKRCREFASQIRQICAGMYEEVEILPERYNQLYEEFQKEGQNLNHLLAWGHTRAMESLLERCPCSHAVADQFGDERYISSRLMQKGKQLKLTQLPRGERYLAVAAASILARDRFLTRMAKFSKDYGFEVPKGASDLVIKAGKEIVEKKGAEELRKVAKLHHKTTEKVLQNEDGNKNG